MNKLEFGFPKGHLEEPLPRILGDASLYGIPYRDLLKIEWQTSVPFKEEGEDGIIEVSKERPQNVPSRVTGKHDETLDIAIGGKDFWKELIDFSYENGYTDNQFSSFLSSRYDVFNLLDLEYVPTYTVICIPDPNRQRWQKWYEKHGKIPWDEMDPLNIYTELPYVLYRYLKATLKEKSDDPMIFKITDMGNTDVRITGERNGKRKRRVNIHKTYGRTENYPIIMDIIDTGGSMHGSGHLPSEVVDMSTPILTARTSVVDEYPNLTRHIIDEFKRRKEISRIEHPELYINKFALSYPQLIREYHMRRDKKEKSGYSSRSDGTNGISKQ
ncbi:MAG: hypothetical protein QMD97_04095, partial [Candidatus Aenigmarchaeota archaeon]|nr:hypothetical protein [Candidatus Aenigmarchaeota archaeon]